jgi:hypothetical protein
VKYVLVVLLLKGGMGFKYLGETRREGRHVIRERFRFPYYISFKYNLIIALSGSNYRLRLEGKIIDRHKLRTL